MKSKFILVFLAVIILSSCVGVSSSGIFGTGVSVALDPRTVGTQIDDSITVSYTHLTLPTTGVV